jgi:RNAse (barnase) inhibitor barstar
MRVHLDGSSIDSEAAFREQMAAALHLRSGAGSLDSLESALTSDVERPLHLVWDGAHASREVMPEGFSRIVDMLRKVQDRDVEAELRDRLQFELH